MDPEAERAFGRMLHRQHGAFSRKQAIDAGFTSRMIDRRVESGRWRRVARGVFADSSFAASWEQRCMAALLTDPEAVLGGRSAAVVYELPGFRPGRVRLTVPPGARRSNVLAQLRRSPLVEARVVNGFRINSVPLVLIEVAGEVTRARLDRAVEDAVLRRLVSIDEITAWCELLGSSRRPGIGRLRSVVTERGGGLVPAESELEAMLFAALDVADIPAVTRQAPFPWAPDERHRVDGYIEEWGILIEADGRRWHARLESMERDRQRDQEAIRRGYLPMRFGWTELRNDPVRVREIVRDAGRYRTARPTAA